MRSIVPAAIAALALLVPASDAAAAVTTECEDPPSSAVFSRWSDPAQYFLAPDGGFENGGAGWSLRGAAVVDGNETFELSGPGERSLALPEDASATSPSVCVGLAHPTFRYVLRKTKGPGWAALRVSVVLPNGMAVPVGTVGGSSKWAPSPVTLIGANLFVDSVAFRFTALAGDWQIDDVYVDPSGSR